MAKAQTRYSTTIASVQLTVAEWENLTGFMINHGVSRHNDTIKSIIGQVEYAVHLLKEPSCSD